MVGLMGSGPCNRLGLFRVWGFGSLTWGSWLLSLGLKCV